MRSQSENRATLQAMDKIIQEINAISENALRRFDEDQKRLNQRISEVFQESLQNVSETQLTTFERAIRSSRDAAVNMANVLSRKSL